MRRRTRVNVSLITGTLVQLDELRGRWSTSRGPILDKLVDTCHRTYADGKMHCVTGRECPYHLTDVPRVM